MKWRNQGPKPSSEDIRAFEQRVGEKMPEGLIWLLTEVANGGAPPTVEFPTPEMGPNEGAVIQALYGVDHPDTTYNFDEALRGLSEYGMSWRFPFGYDIGGGQFIVVRTGPQKGQIRFIDWDDYCDSDISFFIANNMREFVHKLLTEKPLDLHNLTEADWKR
jgi:hypothetical protein